ncbi:uncharacterized protein K444DRAFT_339862 [Hyaloscypha bicolor E]|uniref:Uncharacterized protein n=1 Tax=Hyaloscypha bicolor E TaxID=1095630 RepID=A0A2J6TH77_9HELO|nr:uncharacterized protein K444DRAFT_339862 [Hyaloscypha bicolor E]PMD62341.1 hypothetical protein K444DRAFT_339862 [Hyaloscypha bicolor E]
MRVKQTVLTLYAFVLTYGALVTANPLPDNEVNPSIAASEVSKFIASSEWDPTTPVGYVCCKSIGKDGCQDCNFKQDCPSGKDRQCPAVSFAIFSFHILPLSPPTRPSANRTHSRVVSAAVSPPESTPSELNPPLRFSPATLSPSPSLNPRPFRLSLSWLATSTPAPQLPRRQPSTLLTPPIPPTPLTRQPGASRRKSRLAAVVDAMVNATTALAVVKMGIVNVSSSPPPPFPLSSPPTSDFLRNGN